MDAQGRESVKEQASRTATDVKEKVADLGRKATDKIDEQRVRAASTFDETASALHERGDRLVSTTFNAVHGTADKIQAVADYLRDHDARAVLEDIGGLIRRHPGEALAAAAVAGFFAGRALRNKD